MGLFDKIKTFAGGSSMVTIEFIDIERQAPAVAQLPVGDSVIKGRYRITAQKDCTVLRHVHQFRTRAEGRDGTLGTLQVERVEDVNNQVMGAPYTFPYDLKVGQTMDGGFLISPLDVRRFLSDSYGAMPGTPGVECFVKVIIDVKGSPFDPEVEQVIRIAV